MRKNISKKLCALVMSFSLFGSVFSAEIPSEAKTTSTNIQITADDEMEITDENLVKAGNSTVSSDEAYDRMLAMQAKYPTGTVWTNDNTYKWNCGWSAAGCMGFAHLISDAAFGNAGFTTIYPSEVNNIYDVIRVGDVVRVPYDTHSVIVLEKHPDYIVICEGNASGKVRWGRTISRDTILSQCTYIETRYASGTVTMSLGNREATLNQGETLKLEPMVVPADSKATFIWKSSNPSIVEVSEDGTVAAKAYGTAVITATCMETGISASCNITSLANLNIVFDSEYYINKYPDLEKAFVTYYGSWGYYDETEVCNHFINYGMNEGRQASDDFNVIAYKKRYDDLQKAYGSDLKKYYIHYMNYGKKEGRNAKSDSEGETPVEPIIPEEPEKPTYSTIYNGKDYSAVYDYEYYISKYTDIEKEYGSDDEAALNHFVNYGMREGRQAKESFDVKSYKNRYKDLRNAYGSDLKKYYMHYIDYGQSEGRKATGFVEIQDPVTVYDGIDYGAVYDYKYYINKNADIKKVYEGDDEGALMHFVNYGMREGRQAKENFDVKSYKSRYKDLRNAYGSDLKKYYMHYLNYGQREGRIATGTVEVQDPVTVYNGIDYSAVYDYKYYLDKYADLKKAFEGDDEAALNHFVNYGMREGRQAKETFNVTYYRNNYADLQNAFGSDLKKYYMHYIEVGKNEGRKAVN